MVCMDVVDDWTVKIFSIRVILLKDVVLNQ